MYRTNAKLELMTKLNLEVVNIAGDLMYLIIQISIHSNTFPGRQQNILSQTFVAFTILK